VRKKTPSLNWERILAVFAMVLLAGTWVAGTFRAKAELLPVLQKALPEADHFTPASGGNYAAWKDPGGKELIGYVAVGAGQGYGGDLRLAVAVALDGSVKGLAVVEHKETVAFFRRVLRRGVLEALKGKSFSDPFLLGRDVDVVSGATFSTRALMEAAREASRRIASRNLGYPVPPQPSPEVRFGTPEIVLVGLFLFGIAGRMRRFKYRRTARWVSMLTGLLVLGFVFNKPLTLVLINKVLLGYWPRWQLNLYAYILLAGIFLLTAAANRNPYCEWFCPFGATQECLAVIGGGGKRLPQKAHRAMRWFQRALAQLRSVRCLFPPDRHRFPFRVVGLGARCRALHPQALVQLPLSSPAGHRLHPAGARLDTGYPGRPPSPDHPGVISRKRPAGRFRRFGWGWTLRLTLVGSGRIGRLSRRSGKGSNPGTRLSLDAPPRPCGVRPEMQ